MGFKKSYAHLLQPGKIGSLELKNRMIMPGMGTNLAAADGTVSDVIVNYYSRRANGGIGMIITEVCCPTLLVALFQEKSKQHTIVLCPD